MAKSKQTFTAADAPQPESAPPFTAAPEPQRAMPEPAPEPVVEEVVPPAAPVPQPDPVPVAAAEEPPAAEPVLPQGYAPIDTAPQDGRTLKLWFGTGPKQMTEAYCALARWRRSRMWSAKDHAWVETGFWVQPASNLKIECDFRAWIAVAQVTQQDIDASNFAVNQENERRRKALEAKKTKTDAERVAS